MPRTVTVLSAGAIRRSVSRIAQLFERVEGVRVVANFAPAPQVRSRVAAGEAVDVVIASTGALDALASESKIVHGTRAVLGRTRMAVMMRKGASAPAMSDTAAFRRALIEADAVVYNQGASGAYAAKIVDRLALRNELGARLRVVERGEELVALIASHAGRVLGLAQLTNLFDQVEKGVAVELAGLFPDEIQNVTAYEMAVSAASLEAALAEAFIGSFATREAKAVLESAGLE